MPTLTTRLATFGTHRPAPPPCGYSTMTLPPATNIQHRSLASTSVEGIALITLERKRQRRTASRRPSSSKQMLDVIGSEDDGIVGRLRIASCARLAASHNNQSRCHGQNMFWVQAPRVPPKGHKVKISQGQAVAFISAQNSYMQRPLCLAAHLHDVVCHLCVLCEALFLP